MIFMNYPSGQTIKNMRIRINLTQKQLAEMLCISEKTVSKWETGRGLPDTGIPDSIANALSISVSELFSGDIAVNKNRNSNLQNLCFYACPVCKNTVFSMGEGSFSCC